MILYAYLNFQDKIGGRMLSYKRDNDFNADLGGKFTIPESERDILNIFSKQAKFKHGNISSLNDEMVYDISSKFVFLCIINLIFLHISLNI